MNIKRGKSEVHGHLWLQDQSHPNYQISLRVKETLFSKRSDFQLVQVFETVDFGKVLVNDGVLMLSEKDEFIYHDMIVHVPMFQHGRVEDVLIIGGGDGGTAREVLRHANVKTCTMVEIDPYVVKSCQEHIPLTAQCLDGKDTRLDLKIEDGVDFLKRTQQNFDLILIDSTDPIGPAAPLFGVDFYNTVRQRLKPEGLVVSQGESPFLLSKEQKGLFNVVQEVFGRAKLYNYNNLMYPGGLFSFTYTSNGKANYEIKDVSKAIAESRLHFKYYNADIHQACFALPSFQKEILEQEASKA